METDYLAENTLKRLSPELHQLYGKCIAAADQLLGDYQVNFPEFTDHSILHSMEVTNIGNHLIGSFISHLTAEELYIFLMSALLHDTGMGFSTDMLKQTGFPEAHPEKSYAQIIREYHHELSAMQITKNRHDYFIPDQRLASAIAEVSRGHRKTDLMNRDLYPIKPFNLAYLAAVLRLADEMDVSASRNLMLQYAEYIPSNNRDAMEFRKHRSLRSEFDGDRFVVRAEVRAKNEHDKLTALCAKIIETLDYCRRVVQDSAGVSLPVLYVVNEIRYIGGLVPWSMETDRVEETLSIRLSGRLDAMAAPLLDEELANSLGGSIKNLALDFSGVQYVSSAGLRVILGAKKKTGRLGGVMVVRNVSKEVMEIFNITGFASLLAIEE